jgi:hypothetical protein
MPTYTVTLRFTVAADTDEHLRNARAVRAELKSWLESLRATVRHVTVRKEERS